MPLSEIKAVVSDMDGVLWRGDTLTGGDVLPNFSTTLAQIFNEN